MIGLAIYGALHVRRDPAAERHAHAAGLRGLILTIGVAADANIVIFERIKEEFARGQIRARSDRLRLRARASDTIIDANVVTAITALVLFARRDRGRQGLRAHAADRNRHLDDHRGRATRAMLGLLAGFKWFDNPRFMGAPALRSRTGSSHRLHRQAAALVRDLRRRHPHLLVSLAVNGLNLGIDFKGGTADHRSRRRSRSRSTVVRAETDEIGQATPSCRAAASDERRPVVHGASRSAREALDPGEQRQLTTALREDLNATAHRREQRVVRASASRSRGAR